MFWVQWRFPGFTIYWSNLPGSTFAHWVAVPDAVARIPSAQMWKLLLGHLQSFDYGNVCLLMEMIELSVQGGGFEFFPEKQMCSGEDVVSWKWILFCRFKEEQNLSLSCDIFPFGSSRGTHKAICYYYQ